jgi:hypothetical protein
MAVVSLPFPGEHIAGKRIVKNKRFFSIFL